MKFVFCALLVGLSVTGARGDDWPQWLGPQRDGVWRESGLLDKFPAGGPKVLWRKPVGAGYAGPAVADDKVFVIDRVLASGEKNPDNPFAKSTARGGERVLCLDQKTGETVWKHEYPCQYAISYASGPRCTPTVDGDRLYTLGAMGDLYCLDAAKGTVLWSKSFPKDYESPVPVWGFAAHPLVDGDKLICLVGGTNDRLVVAFDKKSGKELWASQSAPGDFGYCPPMVYEFGGRRQLIIWHPQGVVGLDPETGKRIWRVDFKVQAALTIPTPRKVGDDKLFVTSFYNGPMLLKVGADGAEVVWKASGKGEKPGQTRELHGLMCTPFVDGEYIYGVCSYGELRCIRAATGERVWDTLKATRGSLTPAKLVDRADADLSERWSNAFLIRQADRCFLLNEQGDLIIARLTPRGYEEIDRAHVLEATNRAMGRKVLWMHPAFADRCMFAKNDTEIVCVSLAK